MSNTIYKKGIIILISELLQGPFVVVFVGVRKIMLKVWFLSTSCEYGFVHRRKEGIFVIMMIIIIIIIIIIKKTSL